MSDTAPPTAEDLFLFATNDGVQYDGNIALARTEYRAQNLSGPYGFALGWLNAAHTAVMLWHRAFPNDPRVVSAATFLALASDLRTYYAQAALEEQDV